MRLVLGRLMVALACAASHFVALSDTATSEPANAQEVRAWLTRIHKAAGSRNFEGTFVVSAGGAMSSSPIAHYCLGADQYERVEALDGQARNVYRHNQIVHTLWPQTRVALIEQRDMQARFPALLLSGGDHIAEHYDVRAQGVQRVAGREADVLLLSPKDDRRYTYRLWADQASGLLLRAEVLDARGAVLESAAFSQLEIGGKPRPEAVLAPMNKLSGYRVVHQPRVGRVDDARARTGLRAGRLRQTPPERAAGRRDRCRTEGRAGRLFRRLGERLVVHRAL